MSTRADAIHALLPQTQCTRCGFQGCRPYAEALAAGTTSINRCPPGGQATIRELAHLLQTAELALDPECGSEGPAMVAYIDARSLYRLRSLLTTLPSRCHRWSATPDAYGAQRSLYRL